jgi:cytochrome oxidase Cu insertion factor (SCO1/SenC/PrrC family)
MGATGAACAAEPGGLPFPAPGTYKLDRIQRVPFSIVRDGAGLPHLLSSYTTGKITLLTFFYPLCTDPQGCPLAWNAFEEVRTKIKADPILHGKGRLVFFNFDLMHDNAAILRLFEESYKADSAIIAWRFIGSWSNLFLEYTLKSFGQEISTRTNASGEDRIVIEHLLKVFLIDPEGWVREIYNSASLDPGVLINDIKTLQLDENNNNLSH